MKKTALLFLAFLFTLVFVSAQETDKNRVSIGLSSGWLNNSNAYKTVIGTDGFEYYGIKPGFSIGLDMGIFVTEKFRPRVELKFVQMQQGVYWTDAYPNFDKTIVTLYNFDFNINLDYSLIKTEHFECFASLGVTNEFNSGSMYKNLLTDGTHSFNKYKAVSGQFPEAISGGNVSMILKYKINRTIGVTLTPGYNYYFRNYLRINDDSFQRLFLNAGVEFSFN